MTTTSEIPKNLSKSAKKREKKNADKSENPPLMKSAKKREKKPKIAKKGEETSENTEKPTLSKSAKKREKKLKNPNHVHESAAQSKALRYLKLWHTNKEEWKFEKCRQIWLLQNCYNSTKIPKDDFKLLLKYMKTIQGKMRHLALGNDFKLMSSSKLIFNFR